MNTVVMNFKVDAQLKKEAAQTAQELGLSLSTVVRRLLVEFVTSKKVIFAEPEIPSEYLIKELKESEKDIKKLKVKLAEDWYKKLGRNNKTGDDPNDKLLRHTVIALMIGGENEDSIKRAMAQYKKSKSLKELPAELRATILGAVVRYGPKNEWQKLLNAYEHESPELQQDICTALSLAKDPIAVKAILKKALGPKGFVRPQDVMRWLALFLRNKYSRAIAWEYMEKNWNWLEETLSASKSFDYLPTYCASVISTEKWAKKYKEFFVSKKQIKALSRNIAIGIADINARVAWRKRDEANIKQWLNNKTG